MPNHCNNVLKLTNNPKNTAKTLKPYLSTDDTGEEMLDFNKIVPMPEELKIDATTANVKTEEGKKLKKQQDSNIKKYGHKDWYDWSVENWGTKWNSYSCSLAEEGISFDTAWSPPIPILENLAKLTKESWTLLYSEVGMDFCGKTIADETGICKEDQWSHRKSPISFRNEMGITVDMIYSEEELEERERKKRAKKFKREITKKGTKNTLEMD